MEKQVLKQIERNDHVNVFGNFTVYQLQDR